MPPAGLDQFRQLLDGFIFFHLGADAEVEVDAGDNGVVIKIKHSRVRPFQWKLDFSVLDRLAGDPQRFEEVMLDHLTRHRRS